MTKETFEKAVDINRTLKKLDELRLLMLNPHPGFICLDKEVYLESLDSQTENELIDLIRGYLKKRYEELAKEFESL